MVPAVQDVGPPLLNCLTGMLALSLSPLTAPRSRLAAMLDRAVTKLLKTLVSIQDVHPWCGGVRRGPWCGGPLLLCLVL